LKQAGGCTKRRYAADNQSRGPLSNPRAPRVRALVKGEPPTPKPVDRPPSKFISLIIGHDTLMRIVRWQGDWLCRARRLREGIYPRGSIRRSAFRKPTPLVELVLKENPRLSGARRDRQAIFVRIVRRPQKV